MARYVDKFGGSSVADAGRLYAAARKLAAAHREGNEVVGVLSAQAGATDALLARAREIDPDCGGRELDALLSTGELCSVSLCAMALRRLGVPAVSLCGWQAGLLTDDRHGSARVLSLTSERIERELRAGKIVLVAGFQGVDEHGDITTLGRGGFGHDGGRAGGISARRPLPNLHRCGRRIRQRPAKAPRCRKIRDCLLQSDADARTRRGKGAA